MCCVRGIRAPDAQPSLISKPSRLQTLAFEPDVVSVVKQLYAAWNLVANHEGKYCEQADAASQLSRRETGFPPRVCHEFLSSPDPSWAFHATLGKFGKVETQPSTHASGRAAMQNLLIGRANGGCPAQPHTSIVVLNSAGSCSTSRKFRKPTLCGMDGTVEWSGTRGRLPYNHASPDAPKSCTVKT